MNREIKFRMWLGNLEKMSHPMTLNDIAQNTFGFSDKIIPLQYTGMKDNNGKEIYDGDVVHWKDGSNDPNEWRYAKVEYYEPEGSYQFVITKCGVLKTGYIFGGENGSFGGYHELEVIGNIYENPDLK